MRIALLSIADLSNFVADDPLVIEPLRRLGHDAEFVPWQAAVDWRKYDGVVIRTPWDYQDHLPTFLRVLQEKEFRPVGGNHVRRSDFRVISATNRNLAAEVVQVVLAAIAVEQRRALAAGARGRRAVEPD